MMGPKGLHDAAELSTRKAHYAAAELTKIPGISLAFDAPFFKEFTVRCPGDATKVLAKVDQQGFHGGIALGQFDRSWSDLILVAVTEKRTKKEIDGLVGAYRHAVAG